MSNSSQKNNVCAVIPFYNECDTIQKIILQTLNFVDLVIAVNDGSIDGSLSKIPNSENVFLISYEKNMGKGFALKKGFEKSLSLNTVFTVTLDADFQHPPEFIPKLISGLKNYDVVAGNRLGNTGSMPLQRIASNKITSFLLSRKTKTQLLDTQCGFRAFKTEILKNILPAYNGYEAESEMLINAAKNDYKIGFVEIPAIYGNEKSKMKSIKTIYGFIKVLLN